MKKILLVIGVAFFIMTFGTLAQTRWIAFDSTGLTEPQITNLQSTNDELSFTITFHGFYSSDTVVNSTSFQRIHFPNGSLFDSTGKPEIPFYSRLFAMPTCDSMQVQIQPSDSLILQNYFIFPVPYYSYDSLNNQSVKFAMDSIFYSQNNYSPIISSVVKNSGGLRDQLTGRISLFPIKFNPYYHSLEIYPILNIKIFFTNSTTDVNTDVGLCGAIANKLLINYSLTDRHAKEIEVPNYAGSVNWIDNLPGNASQIHGDYLIITDDDFYDKYTQTRPLYKFANYRASHNSIDVIIVKASQARNYGAGTYHEEHIRSLIHDIYIGAHADHTFDHKLAYVLFVGRSQEDAGPPFADIVPAAWQTAPHFLQQADYIRNDYYYSCLNTPYGSDEIGDLFVGRFSVRYTTEGENEFDNIVTKIKFYEGEVNLTSNRVNYLACGTSNDFSWFENWYQPFVESLVSNQPYTTLEHRPQSSTYCQDSTIAYLDHGLYLITYYGHSAWNALNGCNESDYKAHYEAENCKSKYKYPFCVTHACESGWYDNDGYKASRPHNTDGTGDCAAEQLIRKYFDNGFIGIVAADRDAHLYGAHYTKLYLDDYIPYVLWHNYSTIAGECVLDAKLSMIGPSMNSDQEGQLFNMNYFGDPALDLMPSGNFITVPTQWTNCPITISSPLIVKAPGGVLTISSGCQINFIDHGSIYVESGATLKIGDGVNIFGSTPFNNITVDGTLQTPNGGRTFNYELFSCLYGNSGNLWGGLSINNTNGSLTFNHCDFSYGTFTLNNSTINGNLSNGSSHSDTNCLFHFSAASSLNLSNVYFLNGQVLGDFPAQQGSGYPSLSVSNCVFHNENSTNDYVIRLNGQAYNILDNTITFTDNIGIDIQNTPWRFPNPYTQILEHNTITRPSAAADGSIGVNIYNSNTDIKKNTITHNEYGIAVERSSTAYIPPYPSSGNCLQQTIAYNYSTQLYVLNSSWPPFVWYNIFDTITTSNPAQYWIYHNCSYCPVNKRDISLNYWSLEPMHFSSFYPSGSGSAYKQTPYCNSKDDPIPDLDERLFLKAIDSTQSGNLNYACILYDSVVYLYPNSSYASPSIKSLFAIEELGSKNYSALRFKYQNDTIYYQNVELTKITQFMIKECDLKIHDYNDALAWLNNEVLNCHDYTDSICALIDIGYINSLMSHQGYKSLQLSAPNGEILPITPKQNDSWYMRHLKDLFKKKSGVIAPPPGSDNSKEINIISIGPNPVTKGNLTVDITTLSADNVSFYLYNIQGKEVFHSSTITKANQAEKVDVNVDNLTSGIYLLTIISSRSGESVRQKVIVCKQ